MARLVPLYQSNEQTSRLLSEIWPCIVYFHGGNRIMFNIDHDLEEDRILKFIWNIFYFDFLDRPYPVSR